MLRAGVRRRTMLTATILASMILVAAVSLVAAEATPPAGPVFDISQLGAQPGGATLATAAIQAAVERCTVAGGGTVRLPRGTWLSGTIVLRSRVTLLLDEGCVLLGSTNCDDYVYRDAAAADGSPPKPARP